MLRCTFSRCNALTTIYADAEWALPSSGLLELQTVYNCKALVDGNGTAWTSANTGYKYCVIDRGGKTGYLMAA